MMDLKDVLFWVFFVLSIVLIIWYVFGNSPTEFVTIITLILTVMFKMWSVSDRQIKLEMRFNTLARDFTKHLGDATKR